ncbi:solute carrier family 66 member 2-like [Sycon ciliatum]|uniref:solute carrier family 66 member 2-like n=1 Tax=Sycon ciliatum TaxID=27933 RepID=UPI0031F6A3F8
MDILPEFAVQLVSWVSSGAMIFGGIVPYIPQYLDIQRKKSTEGFSTHVCLVLLIANILRILFWFGHPFEWPLLMQSILLVGAMLLLLRVCTLYPADHDLATQPRHFVDFEWSHFWRWSHYRDYLQFLASFTVTMIMLTALLMPITTYIEFLGFCALITEAMLGAPQFYHNFVKKSTAGMSIKMVCCWLSGDIFKTVYFLVKNTPPQFYICGSIQVMIDISILSQVFIYTSSQMLPKMP